jgi:hypothetical protein
MKWLLRPFTATRDIYYELRNWYQVKKIVRKQQGSADWDRFGLRVDWIGRIYTVMNPELPGDKGDTKEVLRLKYAERIKPMNLYLDKLGLGSYLTVAYEEIEGSDSLLVVYLPIFEVLTIWKIILFCIFWLIFFITKLDTYTYQGLSWLWNLIF